MADRPTLIQELIADDAAMDRMAYRLLGEVSIETGVIHLSALSDARLVVREVLEASISPQENSSPRAQPVGNP